MSCEVRPVRWTSSRITVAANSSGGTSRSTPPYRPTAVRTGSQMTASRIVYALSQVPGVPTPGFRFYIICYWAKAAPAALGARRRRMDAEHKVAVVVGGGSGMGQATAGLLGNRGSPD